MYDTRPAPGKKCSACRGPSRIRPSKPSAPACERWRSSPTPTPRSPRPRPRRSAACAPSPTASPCAGDFTTPTPTARTGRKTRTPARSSTCWNWRGSTPSARAGWWASRAIWWRTRGSTTTACAGCAFERLSGQSTAAGEGAAGRRGGQEAAAGPVGATRGSRDAARRRRGFAAAAAAWVRDAAAYIAPASAAGDGAGQVLLPRRDARLRQLPKRGDPGGTKAPLRQDRQSGDTSGEASAGAQVETTADGPRVPRLHDGLRSRRQRAHAGHARRARRTAHAARDRAERRPHGGRAARQAADARAHGAPDARVGVRSGRGRARRIAPGAPGGQRPRAARSSRSATRPSRARS